MEVRHRIFVAVTLTPALRASVAAVRGELGAAAHRLRWVPPENLHLTLRFLGEIRPPEVMRVVRALKEAAAPAAPFAVTLAGAGAFPTARDPRVVWVGVTEGADRLVALAGALEAALRRREFPGEARPFRPHLTVARPRAGERPPDLTAALAGAAAFVAGSQRVGALAVMESTLRPSGSTYREVAREVLMGQAR